MARPFHAPDFLPLFPGAVREPLDALEDPDFSSDEEDAGELPGGRYFDIIRERGLDEASDEADSGYGSLSEEDVTEEEDEDTEGEEEDEDTESEDEDTESEDEDTESEEDDQRLPPEACPRGTPLLQLWRFLSREQRAASPPPAPCPVFEEERRPAGSRRHRDEDEEEEPISKRPRVSYSEDIEEEPTPSTSAGTSGGFVHCFQPPHLLQDSDSD